MEHPVKLATVHNVFHVSQLKKCVRVPEVEIVALEQAWLEPDLSLVEHPMKILDKKKEEQGGESSRCTRFNGITTPRKKPRGKRKIISTTTSLVFFFSTTVSPFATPVSPFESRGEILFMGGGL